MAMDVIPFANESRSWCLHNIDPEIETFELISIYPIDCVNLSIFRRNKRQSIKAHFCNNRIKYYELGGFEKKKVRILKYIPTIPLIKIRRYYLC